MNWKQRYAVSQQDYIAHHDASMGLARTKLMNGQDGLKELQDHVAEYGNVCSKCIAKLTANR
jgi:hypothetical protein